MTASGKRPSAALAAQQASFDAEYQQWRDGQLRKLDQAYPEWRLNSYQDFIAGRPDVVGRALRAPAHVVVATLEVVVPARG